jgi:hypothetical protein
MDELNQAAFHELSFYTLAHPDTVNFIHQHIVDAYQAQTADAMTKPIGLVFSLVGLYLQLEKNYTGREVQLAHMKLAKNKKLWPAIELPLNRGQINVTDVLKADAGEARDIMIRHWCESVWAAYKESHKTVAALVSGELGLKG